MLEKVTRDKIAAAPRQQTETPVVDAPSDSHELEEKDQVAVRTHHPESGEDEHGEVQEYQHTSRH